MNAIVRENQFNEFDMHLTGLTMSQVRRFHVLFNHSSTIEFMGMNDSVIRNAIESATSREQMIEEDHEYAGVFTELCEYLGYSPNE